MRHRRLGDLDLIWAFERHGKAFGRRTRYPGFFALLPFWHFLKVVGAADNMAGEKSGAAIRQKKRRSRYLQKQKPDYHFGLFGDVFWWRVCYQVVEERELSRLDCPAVIVSWCYQRQPPMQRQQTPVVKKHFGWLWSIGYIWPHISRFDDLTAPSTHGMHETYEGGWNVAPFPTRGEMKGCRFGTCPVLCSPMQATAVDFAMGVPIMRVLGSPVLGVKTSRLQSWDDEFRDPLSIPPGGGTPQSHGASRPQARWTG